MQHINHHVNKMKGGKKLHHMITETELLQQLYDIKKALYESKQKWNNIVFFNQESLFLYLNQLYCANGETIGDILNKLEQCIPFALTDDSFSLFLSSSQADNLQKMEALRRGFIESCKKDFLLHLYFINDEIQWEHILKTCEELRKKNRMIFSEKRKEQI